MIEKLMTLIDKSLYSFMNNVNKDYHFDSVHPILYKRIREYVLRKGKRIRPLLLLLSYKGYSQANRRVPPSIYYASSCIELLHDFMLIHDDIIDRSELRRGKPTLHKQLSSIVSSPEKDKLGYDLGIIAGDIVYALAIDAFLSIKENPVRKEKALKYFVQTAAFTAMGEFIDTLHGVQSVDKVKEKDVFLNYTLKTARYTFECPLVIGAILAGAPKKETDKLAQIGLLVGQAFQIQDDIIGIFDTQKNIGKSILSDLQETKKTLLVAHAYRHLNRKEKKLFLQLFEKPAKNCQDLFMARKIFVEAGSLLYCLNEIHQRINKASRISLTLKMNPRLNKEIMGIIFRLLSHSSHLAVKYGITLADK